MGHPL
jgi:hypothetical protein